MNEPERMEIEERLRRTYQAVAAATRESGSSGGELRSISNRSPRRRMWVGAAAASLVLVMVAAVAWTVTQRDGAVADDGDLVHVLPGVLPSVDDDLWRGLYVLTTIETSADRDELVWSADGGSVRLTTDRSGVVEVPSGSVASIREGSSEGVRVTTDVGVTVWWEPRPDITVELAATGDAVEVVDEVLDSLFLVDTDAWTRATGNGGFSDEVLMDTTLESGSTAEIVGSVHQGYSIRFGPAELRLSGNICSSTIDWDRMDPDDRSPTPYIILVRADRSVATVAVAEDAPVDVAVTPPFPGLDLAIGALTIDQTPSDDVPELDCDRNGR